MIQNGAQTISLKYAKVMHLLVSASVLEWDVTMFDEFAD